MKTLKQLLSRKRIQDFEKKIRFGQEKMKIVQMMID